ncbi:MAG: DUF4198 domain-containing protein [Planctomycetaceae bacterium]|jgi:hypothetical protein|nr:DUF4198 domain-containing protein [Planctomycetaceae bacterium]
MKKFCSIGMLLFFVLTLTGCGVKTARVSGRVTFDGEPAKDISVLFQPLTSADVMPEAAVGMTNANGEFSLSLMNSKKRGAIPGEYVVYISWVDPNPGNPVEGVTKSTPIPYKIPTRATNGEMTFTVPPEGTKEANFDFDTKKESYKPSGI